MDKEEQHNEILRLGYVAGKNKNSINKYPESSCHPAFIHGFMMGRSDLLTSMKIIKHPLMPAAEARATYEYIKAVLRDEI